MQQDKVKRHKEKRSPKGSRFGCKQRHGSSRARYFAVAPYRIAANKERRIKKEARRQQKCKQKDIQ